MADLTNDEIRAMLSTHGGEICALTTVLAAICETLLPGSELAGLINERLEQRTASMLHNSQNEPYLEGFERTQSFLVDLLELNSPSDSSSR